MCRSFGWLGGVAVLAVLLCPALGQAQDDGTWQALVKLGLEGDSNPRRFSGEGSDSDFLERAFVDLGWSAVQPDQVLSGALRLGIKRFHDTEEEDTLVADLTATLQRRLVDGLGVFLGVSARDRLERGHFRDYFRVQGRAGPYLRFDEFDIRAGATVGSFVYRPDDDLSNLTVGALAQTSWTPLDELTLTLTYSYDHREYRQLQVLSDDIVGLRYAQGQHRLDDGHSLGLMGSLQTVVLASLEGYWQRNTSDSYAKSYSRWVVRAQVAVPLPLDLALTTTGTLQRTFFDDEVLIDPTFAIDDDNRNAVEVALSGEIVEWMSWEARYSLFTQEFSDDDTDYERHLVYGGLSVFWTNQE